MVSVDMVTDVSLHMGPAELKYFTSNIKYKTEFCKNYHSNGFCEYGPKCHFIH